jgi:pimeloyl-ACP methyl ester carboxylesterase
MHLVCCGAGYPILFIHGMPTSGQLWNGVIKRLCGSYRCFAVDLPGMGNTPHLPYDADYLRHLAEHIDEIRIQNKIDRWHVVGHDAGSVVAVHYAYYFQEHVACMALLSPALFPELKPYFLLEALRKPILGEMLAPLIGPIFWKIAMQRAVVGTEHGHQLLGDFYRPFSGFAGPWQFMRILRWGKPALVLAEVPNFLPTLRMPTLIFHGSHDPAIPEEFARRASKLIPNANMVTVESGHFIPLSQPESVAMQLAGFFDCNSMTPGGEFRSEPVSV